MVSNSYAFYFAGFYWTAFATFNINSISNKLYSFVYTANDFYGFSRLLALAQCTLVPSPLSTVEYFVNYSDSYWRRYKFNYTGYERQISVGGRSRSRRVAAALIVRHRLPKIPGNNNEFIQRVNLNSNYVVSTS